MKTPVAKPNTATEVKTSKPFFAKEGQEYHDIKSKEQEIPFFSPSFIQAKLSVGAPDDPYEKEADAMADKVLQRMTDSESSFAIQRKGASCGDEEKIQMKEGDEEDLGVQLKSEGSSTNSYTLQSQSIASKLSRSKGKGQSLSEGTRSSMESAFAADFSQVKVHTDSSAIQMSRELNAKAFTNGSDVYFNRGEYNTSSADGNRLLAHELTHTLQQKKMAGNKLQRKILSRAVIEHDHLRGNFDEHDRNLLRLRRRRGAMAETLLRGRGRTSRLNAFNDQFRVDILKKIIDSNHIVRLLHVGIADPTPIHDLYRNGVKVAQGRTHSLFNLGGVGVTIISPNILSSISNYTGPVSRNSNVSYVVYSRPLSLAHELFGHFYLGLRGSQLSHEETVDAAAGVNDPSGANYSGAVNDFISDSVNEVEPTVGGLHFSPTVRRTWDLQGNRQFEGTYLELKARYPEAHVREVGSGIQVVLQAPPSPSP